MLRQHDKGIAEAEKAVALDPNGAGSHNFLSFALRFGGRHEEAVRASEKAVRLDPFPSSIYLRTLAMAYVYTGRYEEAIIAAKKALNRAPNDFLAHVILVDAYCEAGRMDEARAEAEEVLKINPKYSLEHPKKTLPYRNKTDTDRFVAALRKAGIPETPPLPLPDKPSIAVLPFVNMSGDPEQDYLSDGISEQIITSLSKVSNLFVIARTSSFKYKGKEVDIRRVGRELGVRYVLEGSVQKSGDRGRITAQLIDAKSGNHVWAERYDRDLKDIFALQDEIAMKVLTALRVTLTRGEQARIHARGTNNLTAYLKFLKGHDYALRGNPGDNLMARQIFKEVIALDPQYPGAYSMLAWTHIFDISYGSSKSPGKSIKKAAELVQKALALDDSLTPTLAALGRIYILKGQPEKALAEYERAVSLNPNAAGAHAHYGIALIYIGRPDEAIASFKKAIRLNPISPAWFLAGLAASYRMVGRYEESIAAYKRALDGTPDALRAHIGLTATYSMAGRLDEARAQAAEVLRVQPKFSLKRYSKRLRLKDQAEKDRYVDALRKAGLK
jgi:adenylate cyclase